MSTQFLSAPDTRARVFKLFALLLCLGLGALLVQEAPAQEGAYAEDSVKAAFLYHFAGYVEWPQTRTNGPLEIAVVGDSGVAEELRRILPGRTIGGRPLRVRELEPDDSLAGIDILYIDRQFPTVLSRAASQRHLLVVTDEAPDALERGAIINFVNIDRRIRFEISMRAAEQSGLKLSARLLSAALRVRRSHWDGAFNIAAASLQNKT